MIDNRKVIISSRGGRPYISYRKYKSVKEGDIVLLGGIKICLIENDEWVELSYDEFIDITDLRKIEYTRNRNIEKVLKSSPQAIRQARINDLLKNKE